MRRSLWLLCVIAVGCDPYLQRDGEYSNGAVDPVTFPPAYLGSGGDPMRSGQGSFTEIRAYAGGQQKGYFSFPFPAALLATGADPLKLTKAPNAYVFDPTACTPPKNYVYDRWRDDVRLDRQFNVFTALPTATWPLGALPTWSYLPVVSEVPVAYGGPCQGVKTDTTLGAYMPSGRYLANALIDVPAPVYRVGQSAANSNGLTVQQYGWYKHYLVAYLDGGVVPVANDHMVTQRLYYPRSMIMDGMTTAAGSLGRGYDVLQAARGDAAYSPVCEVVTYDAGGIKTPADLPRDAAAIEAMYGMALRPGTPAYVFCFQVQP